MAAYFGHNIDFIEPCIPIWDFDYGVDKHLKLIKETTDYLLYRHMYFDDITQDVADLIQMHTNLFVKVAPFLVDNAIDDCLDISLKQAIDRGEVPKCEGMWR